jgi:hypothetical protein
MFLSWRKIHRARWQTERLNRCAFAHGLRLDSEKIGLLRTAVTADEIALCFDAEDVESCVLDVSPQQRQAPVCFDVSIGPSDRIFAADFRFDCHFGIAGGPP